MRIPNRESGASLGSENTKYPTQLGRWRSHIHQLVEGHDSLVPIIEQSHGSRCFLIRVINDSINFTKIDPVSGAVMKAQRAKIKDIAMTWVNHLDAANTNMPWLIKSNTHPRPARVFILEYLKWM
jgi:hypothetical protein